MLGDEKLKNGPSRKFELPFLAFESLIEDSLQASSTDPDEILNRAG